MRQAAFGTSVVFALGCGGSASADEGPRLPYTDVGACPFECCVYREWQAFAQVPAYEAPDNAAAIAFHIAHNESVTAETGQVVTIRAGVKEVRKAATIGFPVKPSASPTERHLHVKPGDKLYSLHYVGEGYELFWYEGALYQDEIAEYRDGHGNLDPNRVTDEVSRAEYVWWVRVRTKEGKVGWVRNPESFNNMDACG